MNKCFLTRARGKQFLLLLLCAFLSLPGLAGEIVRAPGGLPGIIPPGWLHEEYAPNSWTLENTADGVRAGLTWQAATIESADALARRMTGDVPPERRAEANELYFGVKVKRVTVQLKPSAKIEPTQLSFAFFEYGGNVFLLLTSGAASVSPENFLADNVLLTGYLLSDPNYKKE